MRAWQIAGGFGLDHLQLVERPDPRPGPGEVLIAVRACSLNYRDLLMVRGHYNPRQPLPLIPLSDGVGSVVELGEGVSGLEVGSRVAGLFSQTWVDGPPDRSALSSTLGGPLDGMLTERIVLPASGVIPVPAHLDDAEAATLPCAALTAWSALITQGGLQPGQVVLLQGTGGVSTFALQFARMAGARVIATTSSEAKAESLRAAGAEAVIDYRADPDWGKTVRKLSGGVDHVIEVGGAGTLAQSIRAVRQGGTISLIGVLAGGAAKVDLTPVLMRNVRIQGVFVGHRHGFEAMNAAIATHEIRPVVDRSFPFDQAPAALEHLASGAHRGKVCVTVAS